MGFGKQLTRAFILLCFITPVKHGNCQLFPGLEGEDLVEAIREEFTPHILLNDTQVKDTLYAKIFIQNDTVKCIYSGLPRFLPQGVDPSQFLFGNGSETESINLEHGWPQAKGATEGTNGNVDMHHLYPSRTKINSDRANVPFKEIDDNETTHWYYLWDEMPSIPATNVNAYSEFVNGKFEPREPVAGDIARAMFYFWTIYRDEAYAADPDFFEQQRESLCDWHLEDPADEFEMLRNQRIAFYQGDKLNPFILDCTLVKRAYCPQNNDCVKVSAGNISQENSVLEIDNKRSSFRIISNRIALWEIKIINLLGQEVASINANTGEWCQVNILNGGYYFAMAISEHMKVCTSFYKP